MYAAQITAELLSVQLSLAGGETCPCPKCGSGRILFYPKVAKCSNVDCTLTIFRNKCDKQLTVQCPLFIPRKESQTEEIAYLYR